MSPGDLLGDGREAAVSAALKLKSLFQYRNEEPSALVFAFYDRSRRRNPWIAWCVDTSLDRATVRRRRAEWGRVANFQERFVGQFAGTGECPLAESSVCVRLNFPSDPLPKEILVSGTAWLVPDLNPLFLELIDGQISEARYLFGDAGMVLFVHGMRYFLATSGRMWRDTSRELSASQ